MLRAIIFDFNGVILDDEEYHYLSLKRVLAEEGVDLAREVYYRECLGFGDVECFQWALPDEPLVRRAGGMDALLNRKSACYEELLRRDTRFFPGVCAFIRRAAGSFVLAVASMALRREIDLALRTAGLTDLFSVIVSAESVSNPKPNPEVYLKALEGLNRLLSARESVRPLRPEECLVIEDSVPGIRAAKAAGMRVVALTHTLGREVLEDADRILPSLEGVPPEQFHALFGAADSRTYA